MYTGKCRFTRAINCPIGWLTRCSAVSRCKNRSCKHARDTDYVGHFVATILSVELGLDQFDRQSAAILKQWSICDSQRSSEGASVETVHQISNRHIASFNALTVYLRINMQRGVTRPTGAHVARVNQPLDG